MLVVATVQGRLVQKIVQRIPGASTVIHTVPRCTDHLQDPSAGGLLPVAGPLPRLVTIALRKLGACAHSVGGRRTSRVACGLAAPSVVK